MKKKAVGLLRPGRASTQAGNDERERLRNERYAKAQQSQALNELRWMEDRGSQPRWHCLIVAWQKVCRLQITAKIHREIRDDNRTRVSPARAVRTWGFVVARS